MEKVYVIGAASIETAKAALGLKEDVEIICITSVEDIPFSERIKLTAPKIERIHELSMIPKTTCFDDNKKANHKKPYKFHK